MKITTVIKFLCPELLCVLLLGVSLPGFFFETAVGGQAFSLPEVLPAIILCAGACCGAVLFRFCKAVRKPLAITLTTALLVTLFSRLLRAYSFEIFSVHQCTVLYSITFIAGAVFCCGILLVQGKKMLQKAAAVFIAGGLLRLCADFVPFQLPLGNITVAVAIFTAIMTAIKIAAQTDTIWEKQVITAGTIAAAAIILFVPVTGVPQTEKIFTMDGPRFIEYTAPGSYIVRNPAGEVTAYSPADYLALPSLLPATLQSDNHNLQTLLVVSPASLLVGSALQMPRIAAVDHLSGDPEFAAATQANIITTAEVKRFDKISQLRGPYDLVVVTGGDPNDFIPFMTSRGVLAVSPEKTVLLPEDTFKYKSVISGAGYFVLYSNVPLTTDWHELQKRYDNYDGKLKNFPSGILAALYRWAHHFIPEPETLLDRHYAPVQKLPETDGKITFLTVLAAVVAVIVKAVAGKKRKSKFLLKTAASGIMTAVGVWATCNAVENMAIPLFYHGFVLFLPVCVLLFFPAGAATSKFVYMLLPLIGCGMLACGTAFPSLGITGGALLCIFGCRPLQEDNCSAATTAMFWSAGAATGFTAMLVITLLQSWIFVLLPFLVWAV